MIAAVKTPEGARSTLLAMYFRAGLGVPRLHGEAVAHRPSPIAHRPLAVAVNELDDTEPVVMTSEDVVFVMGTGLLIWMARCRLS